MGPCTCHRLCVIRSLTSLVEGDAHLLRWDRHETFQLDSILSKCGFGVWWDEFSDEVRSGREF